MVLDKSACSAHASDAAWSCVVDDTPKIWSCLIPWLATVVPLGRIGRSQIHIHHVCELRPAVTDICQSLGVHLHRVPPFDRRAPELNKIRQCASRFETVRQVVLTDVDVVFNGVVPVHCLKSEISGKCVDHPNPSIEVLRGIFSEFGLKHPTVVTCRYNAAGNQEVLFETFRGNFNGGVYIIAVSVLKEVGERWSYWANRLLNRRHLLGRWQRNIDQVSFCMATNELGLSFEMLDDRWNYPLHLPTPEKPTDPFILHHHGLLDETMLLLGSGNSFMQPHLSSINNAISQFRLRSCDG
jgi:hypothetical protein